PTSDPQRILVPGYPNPGNGDDNEYLLDLEVAGATAPDASLIYVFAPEAWTAVSYIIDQNLAPILSTSFGGCEWVAFTMGTIDPLRFLAQQANAEGITWVGASGDTGAAACELPFEGPLGHYGIGVNVPSSLPEVTGVGGTEFVEGTGKYWSEPAGAALSYIPE